MQNLLRLVAVTVVLLVLSKCTVSTNLQGMCAEGQCTEMTNPNRRDCYSTLTRVRFCVVFAIKCELYEGKMFLGAIN